MRALTRPHLLGFERAAARRNALLVLLVAAIVSPDIPTPAPLPAIRLEQMGLALLLPSFFLFLRRHGEARRTAFIDWAFLGLGVAIALSLVFAPLIVTQSHWSFRDPFEVARVAEYWLMYRLAFTVDTEEDSAGGISKLIVGAAIVSGVIGTLQYLGPPGFNDAVTSIWADSHNFDGVVKRSRVVGMVGNPNYFGIFAGMLLIVLLSMVLLRSSGNRTERRLVAAAVLMATGGLIMSQSRTAALAVLGALFLGVLFVIARRRRDAAYGTAMGLFVASVVLSVAFVEAFPPKFGTFHDRFKLSAFTDDPSVTIRISKWKSLLSGFFQDTPDRCARTELKVTKHHEPVRPASTPASAEALSRDATRKQDIGALSLALHRFSCDTNRWPTGDLAEALIPKYLPALPTDPATGEQYLSFVDAKDGFLVGANLENPVDPEGPVYALGTIPNIIVNPSFEQPNTPAARFDTARSVDGRPTTTLKPTDQRVFGKTAINADIGATGSVYQLTVFDFPLGAAYTASVWVRSNTGTEQTIYFYLIGILSDGSTLDPMASKTQTVPGSGQWVPVVLTFKTPSANRLSVLQTSVRAPGGGQDARLPIAADAHVTIDGMMVNEGPFPASFPYVTDVDPSRLRPRDLAGFSDSPIIGIGPQKDRQVGAFDNEYALMLDRYGLLGTTAYLALFLGALVVPLRCFLRSQRGRLPLSVMALSLGVATYTLSQLAFNVAAGSYYSFQIMAIYWLLIGLLARCVADTRVPDPSEAVMGKAPRGRMRPWRRLRAPGIPAPTGPHE